MVSPSGPSGAALWRGDPLLEFTGEPWAVPVAARLMEARDLALEDRIDVWLALGRHAQAVTELEVIAETLERHGSRLSPRAQALLHASLLTERIRFGQLTQFDAEFAQTWRLAADVLHSPELQGQLHFVQAARYLAAGDAERGAGAAERGFQSMPDVTVTWRKPACFVMESCVMLITGTLGEHAEQMAARLARPDHPSVPHLAAPAAALGFVQRGDTRRACQIVSEWFAPPPLSWSWMQAIAYWAQVAAAIGVPDPAWLRERLAPHEGELAVVGVAGADCGGAVDSLVAGLAWRLGRSGEAAEHARAGLELEKRTGSQIWIRRTIRLLGQIGTGVAAEGNKPADT